MCVRFSIAYLLATLCVVVLGAQPATTQSGDAIVVPRPPPSKVTTAVTTKTTQPATTQALLQKNLTRINYQIANDIAEIKKLEATCRVMSGRVEQAKNEMLRLPARPALDEYERKRAERDQAQTALTKASARLEERRRHLDELLRQQDETNDEMERLSSGGGKPRKVVYVVTIGTWIGARWPDVLKAVEQSLMGLTDADRFNVCLLYTSDAADE